MYIPNTSLLRKNRFNSCIYPESWIIPFHELSIFVNKTAYFTGCLFQINFVTFKECFFYIVSNLLDKPPLLSGACDPSLLDYVVMRPDLQPMRCKMKMLPPLQLCAQLKRSETTHRNVGVRGGMWW